MVESSLIVLLKLLPLCWKKILTVLLKLLPVWKKSFYSFIEVTNTLEESLYL